MGEQAANSTVVFKNGHPSSKPQTEEERIYCNVKMKAPAAALKSSPDTGDKKPGVLVGVCVLLLGSIAVLVYLAITMTNQRAENLQLMEQKSELENRTQLLSREKNELLNLTQDLSRQRDVLQNSNKQLMEQKSALENRNQLLSREKNELLSQRGERVSWKLRDIMAFDCQPCPKTWIPFKDHCYFFNELPWKQWDQSRAECKSLNPISDLVVIESLEEQKFIHNQIKYYFDEFHGFWIGLQNTNNNWVWVDGQTDTLGFWMNPDFHPTGPKALMIPNQPLNESWDPAQNKMLNKFICESKAVIKE